MDLLQGPYSVVLRHEGQNLVMIGQVKTPKDALDLYKEAQRGHPYRTQDGSYLSVLNKPGTVVRIYNRSNQDVTDEVRDWAFTTLRMAADLMDAFRDKQRFQIP